MKQNLTLLITLLFAGVAFGEPAAVGPKQTVVIVNQAADAIVNYLKLEEPLGKGATREMALAALRQTVDQYQGTGVSHVFWNVNYQRVAYRSAVWPSYWDVPDPEKNVTDWPRKYYELHKLGIDDAFAIVIPRCRERGVSPWISLRMNDHHYTGDPSRVSPLFFEHPELRTRGGKGLFNYARPEVREHYLKLAAEALQRYDVDGLELDWIRTADNFNIDDIERGRKILTDFVRAVRRETQAAAQRRGHPVQLAVRVPAKPEFAHGLGFDVVAWAREALVDMVIPSDYWNGFADLPVEDWRAQIGVDARQCRIVPFTGTTYACTKGWMVNVMSRNLAAMRGFAASMLDRGADGIYFFNNFQPVDSPVLLRTLEGKEVVDCQVAGLLRAASDLPGAMANARVHAVSIYETLPPKSTYQQVLPAEITPQKSLTLKIHTGPKPATGRCVIRVGLDESDDLKSAQLAVRLNGAACRALEDLPAPAKPDPRKGLPRMNVCEVAPRLAQFEAPLDAVVRGYNAVELTVEHGGPQTVIWLEVLMDPAPTTP
ncbi:MAG: hypothetical protein H8E44_01965 [Planctomycetes bacterium]|nr:hypothetical protein [Planctomycetota bacterium]